jgi:tRNA pseudouridine55 synthase
VRTVINDVGQVIGCGAHMTKLSRTRIGNMSLENATNLDNILAMDLKEIDKLVLHASDVALV